MAIRSSKLIVVWKRGDLRGTSEQEPARMHGSVVRDVPCGLKWLVATVSTSTGSSPDDILESRHASKYSRKSYIAWIAFHDLKGWADAVDSGEQVVGEASVQVVCRVLTQARPASIVPTTTLDIHNRAIT